MFFSQNHLLEDYSHIVSEISFKVIGNKFNSLNTRSTRNVRQYYYSGLLNFNPEILIEGDKNSLIKLAEGYIYSRIEIYQLYILKERCWEEKTRIMKLFAPSIPSTQTNFLKLWEFKRIFYATPKLFLNISNFDFETKMWKKVILPPL